MKFSLFFTCIILPALVQSIQWQPGNWAMDCDFPGNDLKNARISGERCGGQCEATSGCTHFAYSNDLMTCFMKRGPVTKSQAVFKRNTVCGIINGGGDGGNPDPDPNPNPDPELGDKYCGFLFGRSYDGDDVNYDGIDYMSIWAGSDEQFNKYWHGDMLRAAKKWNKLPVFYGYSIAFMARRDWGLQDCNVPGTNLCEKGAKYIRENRDRIVENYRHYAEESAKIIGKDAEMIWLIEPDFHQYYGDHKQEGGTLSGEYMRSLFDDLASAIKSQVPNAKISWDISPWLSEHDMRRWWGYFASSPHISMLHTSGGGTLAWSDQIRAGQLRWRFMHELTGRKIIADTGYGVAGIGEGHDNAWDDVNNLKNRINDGVMGVSQGNAKADWKNTIDRIRPQLPRSC